MKQNFICYLKYFFVFKYTERSDVMKEKIFGRIFAEKKPIIGMIHVWRDELGKQVCQALDDLEKLQPFVDGVIIENYGWGHYDSNLATNDCERTIRIISNVVAGMSKIPVGINMLPNDYIRAFRVAHESGCNFIQMDHIYGEFLHCSPVYPQHFMRTRDEFSHIAVLGGIHPKYYDLQDPKTPIEKSAKEAIKLADAIVVTGKYTGGEARLEDLKKVKSVIGDTPLIIGSGLNIRNIGVQMAIADGAIVGTALKRRGVVKGEPVDADMTEALMKEVKKLR